MIGSAMVQGLGDEKQAIGKRAAKTRSGIEESRCNPASKPYD
jgi:hypothetical protein